MGVQGYLSLYTVLLGWQSYDAIWNILTQLGLIMLPFGIIAIKSFVEPLMSMGAKDSGIVGARRFMVHMSVALFVLMLAGAPIVTLQANVLHFKPHCDQSASDATPGHTGTTYDNVLPIPTDVKVPMVWYIIMALSNGITDQAENIISCPEVNLRSLEQEINFTSIKSEPLKRETQQFYNDCYLPAYNHFVNDNDKGKNQSQIEEYASEYGDDDVSWIGSNTFQNISGYYDSFTASTPIIGFPVDLSKTNDQIQSQAGDQKWGAPTCKTWWQDRNIGLREHLISLISDKAKRANAHFSSDTADAEIRAIIEKSTLGGILDKGYYSEENGKTYGGITGKAVTELAALSKYPFVHILMNMLPIIQAVTLAATFMMLAIGLPLSHYSLGFCVKAAVFIFSLTFCSFLWHWVTWIDNTLLTSLYGTGAKYAHWYQYCYHLFSDGVNPNKTLVDITICIMYVTLPSLWVSVATWAGIQVGNALNFAMFSSLASSMSSSGMSTATGTAKGVIKLLTKK